MSAVARNYAYIFETKKDGEQKPIPTLSKEALDESKKNVEKYLGKKQDD